jgi:RNA polymerase sigma-70 factor (ECF subfamily)
MASIPPLMESDGGLYLVGENPSAKTMAEKQRLLAHTVERYFEDLRRPVYAYVFSICRSPERAEEITQDAFLRLHSSLQSGETISSVRSWVFRVAHNLAINDAKKRRFELPYRMEGEEMTMRSDALPNPEQQLLRAERSSLFRRGMETLTEHQRYCIQLRAEGFQAKQIAEILKISRGGVVDTLQRAMKRLRKAIV